jgi:hypothetical protein
MVCVHNASTAVRTSKTLFLNDACAIASDTRRSTLRAAPRIMYVHTNGWSKGHGGRVVVLHTATSPSVNLRLKRIDRGACRRNRLLTKCR